MTVMAVIGIHAFILITVETALQQYVQSGPRKWVEAIQHVLSGHEDEDLHSSCEAETKPAPDQKLAALP